MSHGIAQTLRKRLNKLNVSDFHGLISPGLTCYLNSVLQVLFMTEVFRERIKRCSEDIRTLDTHLKDLFTTLERNTTTTHEITKILGINDVYEQRDAAEYFEKILRLTSPNASKIFKGELNHTTKCFKCNHRSDVRSFFWFLPLSIKDPLETYSVGKGLEDFFSTEIVDGENKMYCGQCDKKQKAVIMCEMTQLPDVLTLLLKRFHYDYERKSNVKLTCEAEVPLVLHLKGFIYDLYAMVKHYGYLSGGHYVAYIFSVQTKAWYCFDDKKVKLKQTYLSSGSKYLRSSTAYLLMYMKRRHDPENGIEDKDEVLHSNDEAKETENEECWNRADGAQENNMMLEKVTETSTDTVGLTSLVSHGRPNCLYNSVGPIMQDQKRLSNKQISHNITENKVSTSNSLYTSDSRVGRYSPKIRKANKSLRDTKMPVWKY